MTLSSGGEMVVPSEEQLLSAIKVIKRDHPDWGFRRVHEKVIPTNVYLHVPGHLSGRIMCGV